MPELIPVRLWIRTPAERWVRIRVAPDAPVHHRWLVRGVMVTCTWEFADNDGIVIRETREHDDFDSIQIVVNECRLDELTTWCGTLPAENPTSRAFQNDLRLYWRRRRFYDPTHERLNNGTIIRVPRWVMEECDSTALVV